MIICAIANVQRRKEDGAIQPADVMPWLGEPKEKPVERPVAAEQTRAWFEEVTQAMGGIVHRRNVPLAS